jgi:hypothetical protein
VTFPTKEEFRALVTRRVQEIRETMHDDQVAELDCRMHAGERFDVVEHFAVLEEAERRASLSAHERIAERRERDGRTGLT